MAANYDVEWHLTWLDSVKKTFARISPLLFFSLSPRIEREIATSLSTFFFLFGWKIFAAFFIARFSSS